jgi:hypothetical protein
MAGPRVYDVAGRTDHVAKLGGRVPRPFAGIEGRRLIAAANDRSVLGKKDPAHGVLAGGIVGDDLDGKDRLGGCLQRFAQRGDLFSRDMRHHEELAIIEPDIER